MIEIVNVYYRFDKQEAIRFKKWMIDNDLKQKNVAEKLGVSSSYLSAVLKGKKTITAKTLVRLKKIGYEIEVDEN